MDEMGARRALRGRELAAIVVTAAVMWGVYEILNSNYVQDIWRGWQYEEPAAVADLRTDLELTSDGERIFLATQPTIEGSESFNEHCGEHTDEVSLLGCYNGGKIYVYDVKLESLQASNKVTAAHELLHAVWARMSKSERAEVTEWLEEVRRGNPEWAETEVELYAKSEQLEELYVRVGTKLRDIPAELEKHYGKYFLDRAKIVAYYEDYQAPFRELQEKNEAIRLEILQLGPEIEAEREIYERRSVALNAEVERFNICAGTMGCFTSQYVFQQERAKLEAESVALEEYREQLNQKIERNNNLVMEYEANSRNLGELNDALNSNVKDKVQKE